MADTKHNQTVGRDPTTGRFTKLTGTDRLERDVAKMHHVLEKFTPAIEDMRVSIMTQTGILENISNSQMAIVETIQAGTDLEQERLRDEARQERLGGDVMKVEVVNADSLGTSAPGAVPDAPRVSPIDGSSTGSVIGNFLGNFLGLAGGGAISTLVTTGGAVALGAMIRDPVVEFLSGGIGRVLEETPLNLSEENKSAVSDSLGSAITNGMLAGIVNKKLGIATFVGTLAGDAIESGLNAGGEESKTFFGKEFSNEALSNIMGGVIGGLSLALPSLLKGSFAALKSLPPAFVGRLGLGGMLMTIGGITGDWIGEQTESEAFGDAIGTSLSLAGAGFAVGGPWGAVIGAIAGVAITGAKWIVDWFKGIDEELDKSLAEETKRLGAEKILSDLELGESVINVLPRGSTGAEMAETAGEELATLDDMPRLLTDLSAAPGTQVIASGIMTNAENIADEIDAMKADGVTPVEMQKIKTRVDQLTAARDMALEMLSDAEPNKVDILTMIDDALDEAASARDLFVPVETSTDVRDVRLQTTQDEMKAAGANIIAPNTNNVSAPTHNVTNNSTTNNFTTDPSRVLSPSLQH